VAYRLRTPKNCTCPSLAKPVEDVSPAVGNDLLRQTRLMPREVGRVGKDRLEESQDAFLLVADRGPDKRYSRGRELGRAQYRGNEQRGGRGRGGVSRGHSGGQAEDCSPSASRVCAPDGEGKTKNAPRHERFVTALDPQQRTARPLLGAGG